MSWAEGKLDKALHNFMHAVVIDIVHCNHTPIKVEQSYHNHFLTKHLAKFRGEIS